ncbi:MAG: hypothetical protein ACRC9L_09680 [Brevinema sp.]
MRLKFLLLCILLSSCVKDVKPEVSITSPYLLSSSPVASIEYVSTLEDGRPYYEKFVFDDNLKGSTIELTINGETNRITINNNFDLVRAQYIKQGSTLSVEKVGNSLVYYINSSNITRYQVPAARVIVLPEIQLRDFFYSESLSMPYTQLFTGDFRASAMVATKKQLSNIQTQNGFKEVLPVEITTYGLNPSQWAMILYFDSLGWVVKKEGFINFRSNTAPTEKQLRQNEYSYLGKRAYSSELIIRHSLGFQP